MCPLEHQQTMALTLGTPTKIVEEEVQSGITAVTVKGETAVPVYQINGSRAGTAKDFSVLPKGIYIENGKKVLR